MSPTTVKRALQLTLSTLLSFTAALDPRADLGYAIYEGTSLSNGVNQFLGMRYAAPPLGQNRFRLPSPPSNETGIVQAKEHGSICYGVEKLAFSSVPLPLSEDCLFIDVYAPAQANTTDKAGLPVMLWLQGGAFVQLFNPNYNGTGLVEASQDNVVVVSFNYRVGPYGFLASEELQAENNLNLGLHDQRAAMRWVQQHIRQFGGDPNQVTLFGTSIGGGSVLLQTLAYGGDPPLEAAVSWKAGIAASVYMPPVREVPDLQFQYDQLLNATNCTNLACLRSLDSASFQAANIGRPSPGESAVPLFPYGPVIDGSLLTDTPLQMLRAGKFNHTRPLILGSSHTEGTIFVPQANTTADIASFLQLQFPDLTDRDIQKANDLYATTPSTLPGVTTPESPLYYQLAEMYGDAAFACPTLEFAAGLSEAGVPIHLFRDQILDAVEVAAGYIVPHTWEVQAVWGPEFATSYVALTGADSYDEGEANHAMVSVVQDYWMGFVRSLGDPNALKSWGAPAWLPYGNGMRLKLKTNATMMESVLAVEFQKCDFWTGVSRRTYI
ncbi:carboxylesterase [Coleophoma cylindrospora]|uniref:Carboxylesterase n=1 Tax=Coleophoma cylindrospora TaxID=1849047 RepID=A0A3D8RAF5_9HELO|nr:carboxylesterase [Coleophoma cylindrospora]